MASIRCLWHAPLSSSSSTWCTNRWNYHTICLKTAICSTVQSYHLITKMVPGTPLATALNLHIDIISCHYLSTITILFSNYHTISEKRLIYQVELFCYFICVYSFFLINKASLHLDMVFHWHQVIPVICFQNSVAKTVKWFGRLGLSYKPFLI